MFFSLFSEFRMAGDCRWRFLFLPDLKRRATRQVTLHLKPAGNTLRGGVRAGYLTVHNNKKRQQAAVLHCQDRRDPVLLSGCRIKRGKTQGNPPFVPPCNSRGEAEDGQDSPSGESAPTRMAGVSEKSPVRWCTGLWLGLKSCRSDAYFIRIIF